ncbi:mucin-2-like [Eupeodes corollae]|uniref:mucin-2-like n=1 Tax=Eupeodes corollae TaxID=290404 RepID=UPI0024914216|nr:mucin-2-like [Eupeodes corollae]
MMIPGPATSLRIMQQPQLIGFIVLLLLPLGLTQHPDEPYIVEPTPALRLGDEELTTVLLVSNDNRTASHGRYLNVRPNVGLLTSTARTFIQEGVTTEYATQVLGTTLENGRIYAQLLKKSSRVLFDKESVIAPSAPNNNGAVVHTSIIGEEPALYPHPRSLLQSHNDLVADKDWQDIDDRLILEKNSFVGNTDYIGGLPKRSHIVFPVKASTTEDRNPQNEKILKADYLHDNFTSTKDNVKLKDDASKIFANKVQPVDLPTYTIKNIFSPSGFSWEPIPETGKQDQENVDAIYTSNSSFSVQRSPKLLYHQVIKDVQSRTLSTVTYYGFADFTTVVGDSVIVFSPSTSAEKIPPAQVTSIKGKATLGPQEALYVSQVPITITQDWIEPTFVTSMLSTVVNDIKFMSTDLREKNETEETDKKLNENGGEKDKHIERHQNKDVDDEKIIEKTTANDSDKQQHAHVTDEIEEENSQEETTVSPEFNENELMTLATTENDIEQTTEVDSDNNQIELINLSSSMPDITSIQSENAVAAPTQTTSRIMLSRPSDEEILKIYSSLAQAELASQKSSDVSSINNPIESMVTITENIEEILPTSENILETNTEIPVKITTTNSLTVDADQIQPNIQTKEGATTIFYEDDPFLDFVKPSLIQPITIQPTKLFETTLGNENDSDKDDAITEGSATDASINDEDSTNSSPNNASLENENTQEQFKPIIKEIEENEEVENCVRTSQIYLTQVPKTLTYYTTFFIPIENDSGSSTSIESKIVPSFDISEATKHYCIQSTRAESVDQTETRISSVLERPLEMNLKFDEQTNLVQQATEPILILNENDEVTESNAASGDGENDINGYEDETDKNEEIEDDGNFQESDEEIELIYKTLYTTYTYLTTFFHDSTTTVSSHKEIVTNIITSSMSLESVSAIEDGEIEPTSTKPLISSLTTPTLINQSIRPNAKFDLQSSDLIKIDGILREDSEQQSKLTEQLDYKQIAKTFFTTYTYYTTIFVDGETEIMSRTEIHTNVIGKSQIDESISPSARNLQIDDTVSDEDNAVIDLRPTPTYDTIQRTAIPLDEKSKFNESHMQELESSSSSSSSRSEKKIVPIIDLNIKSSLTIGSNGQNQIVENSVLEDQISSESNTEEIIPSATLLLQTSFTTFTYYTTMYSNEATNVVSRLETITNIVTETLQPTKSRNLVEATLPITYFTTFTYWTKLAKDGDITTLSREETISNVVTPSVTELSDSSTLSISTVEPILQTTKPLLKDESQSLSSDFSKDIEPTTYYTTYTYYTTSYVADQTVTNSRFETVTNVLIPSSISSILPPPMQTTNEVAENNIGIENPTPQIISFDYKTIVDAEGISTLFFKTQVLATVLDGTSTQIASSTSTINIDEVKKGLSTKTASKGVESNSTRMYKTGLVRLIEGTKLANQTTTVYESKVIGTFIDERYAQIIESTSRFIIEMSASPPSAIEASSTLNPSLVQPTVLLVASQDKALESSISDNQDEDINHNQETDDDVDEYGNQNGDEENDESGRTRSRLSFQTKKKTFTPVIRPFVSRNRPQFAPKRKNILQSSATIITRSDLTPTITATPALKSDVRGRFSSSRKSNVGISSIATGGSSSQGGKRFGRPSKSSQFGAFGSSSSYPGSLSRNRIQSSKGGQQGFSSSYSGGGFSNSRRSGVSLRGSLTSSRLFSSAYPGNSRSRIRISSSLPYDVLSSTSSYTTLPTDSSEDDGGVTQKYEFDEETDITTENTRRNNGLLRLRRPQLNRPAFQVTPRRNAANPKPRTTSTTTQRPRARPAQRSSTFKQIQNRARPQNSLFPPRRLFQPQNNGEDFENDKDDNDSSDYENDDEGIEEEEQDDLSRRRRSESNSKPLIKERSKRQVNNYRNRFRRPSTTKPASEERVEDPIGDDSSSTARTRASSRFSPRTLSTSPANPSSYSTKSNKAQHNNRSIRPTKPNVSNRAQFTLREKDTTPKHTSPRLATNFRRPLPNSGSSSTSSRRTTTTASRPKAPRIKNYGNPISETTHSSNPRGRTPSSRSRSTVRSRSRNDFPTDPVVPAFDGTITVTHTTPTEITIPVVNGKVTEYKNVLTTTTSTEVVPPNLYTSVIGQLGSSTLVLNREETSINLNGATEVTQFILHEQPTTTAIFTPTTIRGRKTSFVHIIPSTAYQVENVVSTMQPQIATNAPLANILLSQLLLGNLGNLNQANINPILALGGATQANSQVPGIPTTEYKTKSSTYVTTVTNGMSTIIPLTFHGKEILTTIYDSSSEVITATEYFTETIVVTPTQQAQQVQQVNSLLLPYLLQQQLQGQGQQLPSQPALPIQNSIPPQLLFPENLQDLDHNGIHKYNDYSSDIDDYPNNTQNEQIFESSQNINTNTNTHNTQRSGSRKKGGRKFHKQHSSAPAPAVIESSVITLYVSGRRPGEFSTVLSTVQAGSEPTLRKRQINRSQPLFRSTSHDDYEDYYSSDGSEIEEYLLPASKDIISGQNLKSNSLSEETQSLESIVGDVGLWYTKTSILFGIDSNNSEPSTIYEDQLGLSSTGSNINIKSDLESSSSLEGLFSPLIIKDPIQSSQSKYFLV